MYTACFGLYLGHPETCQYKNHKKEGTLKNLSGPFLHSLFFTMLKYEIYSIKVLDLCNFKKHMYKEYLAAKYPLMLDSSTRHTSYNILIHL